ncbi:coiled-coil domain-containing protein [Thiomicrospira microaerophila]|uniref:hypothetical protein n=1 Tax=Thiomicrospira microaerophila TaxID=406020 RepID=UPI0005C908EF|nr:hypothetical protein [Thiomicrospira microaerophila]
MGSLYHKQKMNIASKQHKMEYMVSNAGKEDNSDVFYFPTLQPGIAGMHQIGADDFGAYMLASEFDTKSNYLALKDAGWATTIRNRGDLEADHIVLSFTYAESASITKEQRDLIAMAVHGAIEQQTFNLTHNENSHREHSLQVHGDTDNLHVHMLINRHAVDHESQSISTAFDMFEGEKLVELSELINNRLVNAGVPLVVAMASQKTSTSTAQNYAHKTSSVRQITSNNEKLKSLDIDDVSEFDAIAKSLSDKEKALTAELDATVAMRQQLNKALAIHVQLQDEKEKTAKLEAEVSKLDAEVAQRDTTIQSMTEKLTETNGVIENLTGQLDEARSENEDLSSENSNLEAQLEQSESTVKQREGVIAEQSSKIEQLLKKLDEQAKINADALKKIDDFEVSLAEAKAQLKQASEQVLASESVVRQTQTKLNEVEQKLAEKGAQLTEAHTNLDKFAEVSDEMIKTNEDLHRQVVERDGIIGTLRQEIKSLHDHYMEKMTRLQESFFEKMTEMLGRGDKKESKSDEKGFDFDPNIDVMDSIERDYENSQVDSSEHDKKDLDEDDGDGGWGQK